MEFLQSNWIELLFGLIAFAEVIVRLTPTKKDDSILEWVIKLVSVLLPNRKDGGGKH